MGEVVKRLSSEFREQYAGIPWRDFAGMRDKLIHAYDDVDLDQVWETLQQDLPALLQYLEPIAKRRCDPDPGP